MEIFANIFCFCVYNIIMLDQSVDKPGIAQVHVSVCTCWSGAAVVLLGLPNARRELSCVSAASKFRSSEVLIHS